MQEATLVSARGVRKGFGTVEVLRDIDIDLRGGTVTALLGRSGSGKTTLLRALSLLESPDHGTLDLFGERLDFASEDLALPSIWPRLTVVFQDLFLWPHLTCGQNVSLTAKLRDPVGGAERARAVLQELGVSALADRYPTEVSRGQRQLIAFARAAALEPQVLLCDEITASLDVEAANRVGRYVGQLRDKGTAVLLITHQLAFARQRADYVVFLDNGTIAEAGASEIITKPRSASLQRFIEQAAFAP